MAGQPPIPKKTLPVDAKVKRHRIAAPAATSNETTLQRFLDTQADSVDGVLAWLNGSFVYNAPVAPATSATTAATVPASKTPARPALNPALPLTCRGPLTVSGAISTSGPLSVTQTSSTGVVTTTASISSAGAIAGASVASSGAVTAASMSSSGNISTGSLSSTGGISAASVNSSGNVQAGSVTSSGAVSGTTCSFPQSDFRYCVGPFPYANQSYSGGIAQAAISYGSLTMGSQVMGYSIPFTGNIVAMVGRVCSNTATTFQPYYYRNNASPTQLSSTSLGANAYTAWGTTYTKGTYPVNVGDFIGFGCGFGTASISVQFTAWFLVDFTP